MELRIAGILLLLAGWGLMIAAVVMLTSQPAKTAFACAGFGVEVLGFVLVARTYVPKRKKRNG